MEPSDNGSNEVNKPAGGFGQGGVNPASAPVPDSQGKKKVSKATVVFAIIAILAFGAAGALGYLFMGSQATLKSANQTIETLFNEKSALENKLSGEDKTPEPAQQLTQTEEASLAATAYKCVTVGVSCDKSTNEVVKIQEYNLSSNAPGFAIVHIMSGTEVAQRLLLKSSDGLQWAVIYEGDVAPEAVVEQFAIPSAFTDLKVSE